MTRKKEMIEYSDQEGGDDPFTRRIDSLTKSVESLETTLKAEGMEARENARETTEALSLNTIVLRGVSGTVHDLIGLIEQVAHPKGSPRHRDKLAKSLPRVADVRNPTDRRTKQLGIMRDFGNGTLFYVDDNPANRTPEVIVLLRRDRAESLSANKTKASPDRKPAR